MVVIIILVIVVAVALALVAIDVVFFNLPNDTLVEPERCPRCGVIVGRNWWSCDARCPMKN
jgi:hypothetical protein